MSVVQQFGRWIGHLVRLDLPVAGMIAPGLDPDRVRTTIDALGLVCPDPLAEFYSYSGGVISPEGVLLNHIWMYGSHFVMNFFNAVDVYRELASLSRWNRNWFPILENGGGDFYSVNCGSSQADQGSITYFAIGSGEPPELEFRSIEDMLVAINECFERGICSVDESGDLDTDFKRRGEITRKYRAEI